MKYLYFALVLFTFACGCSAISSAPNDGGREYPAPVIRDVDHFE